MERGDFDPRSAALATELTSGTLRYRLRLDYIIAKFIPRTLDSLDPEVRNVLRLGTYQIGFTRIPEYAACSSSVDLMKRIGLHRAAGFVNGVLRNIARGMDSVEYPDPDRDPVSWISVTESHPAWMVRWSMKRLGFEETLAWCRANNQRPEPTLRVNRLIAEPSDFDPGDFTPCRYAPDGLIYRGGGNPADREEYRMGHYTIQSEASQLVTLAGGAEPGWKMMDGCAGRGGKATYLAELSGDRGEILAVDPYEDKLRALQAQCRRLGLRSIHTIVSDLQELDAIPGSRDLVLLDVPCSGLGTIGREADARWHKTPEMLSELPPLQGQLLDAGAQWVRSGGYLVYTTCSVAPEENERVVENFLSLSGEFAYAETAPTLPGWSRGQMHLLPHVHGTDGAFAAVLRRR